MNDIRGKTIDRGTEDESEIPSVIPILPNPNYVLYPSMIAPLVIEDKAGLKIIDEVAKSKRFIALCAVKPNDDGDQGDRAIGFNQIYDVGTAAVILKMLKTPEGGVRLLVHGVRRVRITKRLASKPFLRATIKPFKITNPDDNETLALIHNALAHLKTFIEHRSLPEDVLMAANNLGHPGKLADLITSSMSIGIQEQQLILEIEDPKKRLRKVQEILTRELDIAALGSRIQSQIKSKIDKHQRDFVLREQIKAIRQELGDADESHSDVEEFRALIHKKKLPEKALKVAQRELRRIETIPATSPEYTVSHTYLTWILDLPWNHKTRGKINLKAARKILDEDHYDLEKVKDRILDYLAVIKLRKNLKGPILCLVGPPGVGKTSLGRSVARAMGRKFHRLSLGGIRDEAEIRGHRRTYIGAMPGRIIKAMKECETCNPVIMLDEIDKLGSDFRGDPASALLEVLDPEQNNSFTDHYLDLAFDLSKVMFITTANMLDTVPGALRDRMETIHLSGYTLQEKVKIAHEYLIPRAVENSGLKSKAVDFTDEGIETIVEHYTREAGLRNLEREINNVCRKVARGTAEGKRRKVKANAAHIEKTLGPWRFTRDDTQRAAMSGVSIGLAWTPAGGDILFIESTSTPGDGHLALTGQLGDVMKESAQAAITFLRSLGKALGIPARLFRRKNFHIHVPAGAVPKDGPSAGVAMMMSLASLLLDRPIRSALAMTGEITLKGSVLPVGGIKEKILAAHRSGLKAVILPKQNERDLIDVPEEIREDLKFYFVDSAEEVLKIGLPKAKNRVNGKAKKTKTAKKKAVRTRTSPKPRKRK